MTAAAEARKVPLRIRLPFATEAEFVDRYGHHVERTGIFIATRTTKAEGTALSFELVLADGARLMRGEGRVHEVHASEQPGQSGMWVRFTRIDAQTKALIDRLTGLPAPQGAPATPPANQPPAPEPPASLRAGGPAESAEAPGACSSPRPAPDLRQAELSRPADDAVLGIDFGTTACRVALSVGGHAQLLTLPSEGAVNLPAAVGYDSEAGAFLVGSAALRHAAAAPQQVATHFKRLLGIPLAVALARRLPLQVGCALAADEEGNATVTLGPRRVSAIELTSVLLGALRREVHAALGRPVSRAVIAVPAWFNDRQRAAVSEACAAAGLSVLRVLQAPSAIALAFGHGRGLARKRVMVCDLGAGGFAASVVAITGEDVEVVSTGGDSGVGGLDFDVLLADQLAMLPRESSLTARAPGDISAQEPPLETPVASLLEAAEHAKVALTEHPFAWVELPVPGAPKHGSPFMERTEVPRSLLERCTADLIERAKTVTQAVLEAANLSPQALDEVLVVGAQSRAPAVRLGLEALLGNRLHTELDDQAAVALGAALLGESLALADQGKRGVSLSEVLSRPLGLEVRGGGVRRILERNTRLPAEKSLALQVQAHERVRVALCQGSAPRAEDNDALGWVDVAPERGGELTLRFHMDRDGRLTLAISPPGGKTSHVELSRARAPAKGSSEANEPKAPSLPDDLPSAAGPKGFLSGIRRFLGG